MAVLGFVEVTQIWGVDDFICLLVQCIGVVEVSPPVLDGVEVSTVFVVVLLSDSKIFAFLNLEFG